jgi:hypothetical protein
MKLIEPIKNLGSFATSDAPEDGVALWAPIGRDLLRYLDKPVFDIVGDTLVAASSTSLGKLYVIDLSTGAVSESGYTSTGAVRNVVISPDGNYCYVSAMAGSGNVSYEVFEISTGTTEYSSGAISQILSVSTGQVVDDCEWLSDSSKCYFTSNGEIYYLLASTWAISQQSIGAGFDSFSTLTIIGTEVFATSSINIAKINLNFTVSSYVSASRTFTSTAYNPTTSELIGISDSGGIFVINQTTLADSALTALAGSFFSGAKSFKVTSSNLIIRSQSTSPYWSYRLLTDYSLDKSLPALTDPGEVIAVGTTYTVVQQDSGIETLLSADDSILTQTNPSVLVGDTFEYNLKIYEALIDSTDQPNLGALETPATWLDKGAINRLRMFDGKLDNLTTSTTAIVVDITPEQTSSGIALLNLDTKTIQVTMTDPTAGLVYDSGVISMLDNSGVKDWFTYFFSPYIKKSDFVTLSLPPYPDAVIQVTVDGDGDAVSIGQIVMGRTFNIGDSQFGTGVGIIDFSEKEQDAFGNFEILERKFSKRADFDVKIPTQTVSGAQRTLSRFRATPAVWVGDESKEETIIYGYYKSFDIVLSNPAFSDTSILVEGL